jgi:hypothetical protein
MSHAVRNVKFCNVRNFRRSAFVGLEREAVHSWPANNGLEVWTRFHVAWDDELSQGLVWRRAIETAISSPVTRGKLQKLSFFFYPSLPRVVSFFIISAESNRRKGVFTWVRRVYKPYRAEDEENITSSFIGKTWNGLGSAVFNVSIEMVDRAVLHSARRSEVRDIGRGGGEVP